MRNIKYKVKRSNDGEIKNIKLKFSSGLKLTLNGQHHYVNINSEYEILEDGDNWNGDRFGRKIYLWDVIKIVVDDHAEIEFKTKDKVLVSNLQDLFRRYK